MNSLIKGRISFLFYLEFLEIGVLKQHVEQYHVVILYCRDYEVFQYLFINERSNTLPFIMTNMDTNGLVLHNAWFAGFIATLTLIF